MPLPVTLATPTVLALSGRDATPPTRVGTSRTDSAMLSVPIADNDSGLHFGVSSTPTQRGGLTPREPANTGAWEHSGHVDFGLRVTGGRPSRGSSGHRPRRRFVPRCRVGRTGSRRRSRRRRHRPLREHPRRAPTCRHRAHRRASTSRTVWLAGFWLMRLAGALRTSRRDRPCARRALFQLDHHRRAAAVSINGWVTGRFPPAGAWRSPTATPARQLLCAHVLAHAPSAAPTVSAWA